MKTIKINIYKFSELSEKAKEKAVNIFQDINVDFEWWDGTYEDAVNIGLKITSFDLDRRQITGELTGSGLDTANLIIANHGTENETYKTAQRYFLSLKNSESDEEIEETEHEFLNDILEDYLIILRKEQEYLTTKEAIIETIESNEYDFTEDGKPFFMREYTTQEV
jgi:hypothetical protein